MKRWLPTGVQVQSQSPSPQVRPQRLQIDCTCFGGHDLGSRQTWNVCIRTDRHGQSIYGPSVAAVEPMRCDGQGRQKHIGALRATKAISEFQYFTFESAKSWGATSGLAGRARTNRPREPTYLRMPARPSEPASVCTFYLFRSCN